MAADGSVTAVVNLDVSEAEKRVNQLGKDIIKLQDKLSINKNKRNVLVESLKETQRALEEVREHTSVVGDKFITSPENITKMQELQDKIKQIEADIEKCDAQSEKWNTELEAMQQHYGEIEKEARRLSGTVGSGDNVEEQYAQRLEQAKADIESAIEKIKSEWIQPLPELMRTITDSISPKIGETFDKLASKAGETFRKIKEAAKESIDAEFGEQYLQDWAQFFNKLSEKSSEFGKNAAAHILSAFRNIKDNLPDIGESILSGLQNVIPQITAALQGGGISQLAGGMLAGLSESIAAIAPQAAVAVAAIELLIAAFKRLWQQAIKDSVMLVNGITKGFDALVSAIKEAPGAIKRFAKVSGSSLKKVSKLFAEITKNISETLKNINLFSKLSEKLTKVLNRLGNMIRRVFVYSVLTSFFRALRKQVSEYLSLNAEFMTALGRLKSALATAFQPILNVAIPALTALVNVLTKAVSVIAQFIAAIFGTTAKTAQANAKALNDQAKATEAAGSAAEKASQQLAGFDEINTLSFDDGSGGGGAGAAAEELGDALYDLDLDDTWFKSWGEAFDAFLDHILNEGIPALRKGLENLADWVNWFSANLLEMFTFPGVKEKLIKIGEEVGDALNDMVDRINWNQLGQALGAGLDDAIAFLNSLLDKLNFKGLGNRLAELVNGLADMVDWHEFGRLLWAGFKTGLEMLAGFLENLNMPNLAKAASDVVIGFFDAMRSSIERIRWDTIGQQIATFLNNIKWYDIITTAWDTISSAINSSFDMVRNFIDTLRWGDIGIEIYSAINSSIGKLRWSEIGQTIGNALKDVFEFVTTIISGIRWHEIGENIARFILSFDIVGALGSLADLIAAGINAAMELACGLLDLILPEAFNIGNGIAQRIRNAVATVEWAHLGEVVGNGIKTALGFVAGLLDPATFYEIGAAIGDFLIKLDWPGMLEGLGRAIANGIKSAASLIRGFLASVQPNLQEVATDIAEKINDFVKSVDWAELGRTIHDGINTALDFLLSILDQLDWESIGQGVVEFLSNLDWPGLLAKWQKVIGTAIGGALRGIDLSDALSLGMDMVGGILKGAIDKFNAEGGILGWIKRIIFAPFVDGFKSLFGIHSPSTVMQEQGGYVIEGLLLGMTTAWERITAFLSEKLQWMKDTLSEAWENVKATASEKWEEIRSNISEKWEYIKQNVAESAQNILEKVQESWENIKQSTYEKWEGVRSTLSEIWQNIKYNVSESAQNVLNSVSEYWENTKQATSEKWENIRSTLSEKWDNIQTAVTQAAELVKSNVISAWENTKQQTSEKWMQIQNSLQEFWENIKNSGILAFTGLKDSVINIFSGLWNALKGVINSILAGVESLANGVIKGINAVITSLNKLSIDIPDWVPGIGGEKLGFDIKKLNTVSIPRLAAGAVIPPNREFMAVLGDQSNGRNLEAPEGLIRQIVREESGGGNGQLVTLLEAILDAVKAGKVMQADGKTLARIVTNEQNRMTRMSGTPVLLR